MPPMLNKNMDSVRELFDKTINSFRNYLPSLKGFDDEDVKQMSTYDLCVQINKIASTLKGVKNVNPLIKLAKVLFFLLNFRSCA